jgi:uncharacterized protein YlxW (UPF0749 family)
LPPPSLAAKVNGAMPQLSPGVLSVLVLLALALAAFALLVASAPRGRKRVVEKEAVDVLADHDQAIAQIRHSVRELSDEQRRQADALLEVVQQVGLVRYDAFDDMGGHLSFSAALLDAAGNGVVITSINGRQDTRCYAKPVRGGESEYNLSAEEEAAIRQALAPAYEPAGNGRRLRQA